MNKRILIVEGDLAVQGALGTLLIASGCHVLTAATGPEALALFQAEPVDLVFMDSTLALAGTPELLHQFSAQRPSVPIIATTSIEDRLTLQPLLEKGAWNCVDKHVDGERLHPILASAFAEAVSAQEMDGHRNMRRMRPGVADIFGTSPAMTALKQELLGLARQLDGRVIVVTGATGTGKSLFARALHRESERAEDMLLALDCATLPSAMVESELFGLDPDNVTGIPRKKPGLFTQASLGAVLLENVSELAAPLRLRLVEALGERGAGGPSVLLTCREEADKGEIFPEGADLPKLHHLRIPPLRERPEDLLPLLRKFLMDFSPETALPSDGTLEDIAELLAEHEWPGNVRELKQVVRRAVADAPAGEFPEARHFVIGRGTSAQSLASDEPIVVLPESGCTLDDVERCLLEQALERTEGNQSQAALLLGITRDQLRYKVRKHGLR